MSVKEEEKEKMWKKNKEKNMLYGTITEEEPKKKNKKYKKNQLNE
jgi:hypothetical protein